MSCDGENLAPDAVRFSYEDLRAQALTGCRGPGFAIFLNYGMREWIKVCSSCLAVVALPALTPAEPTNHQPMLPALRSEIVSILAGLLLQRRWEATL